MGRLERHALRGSVNRSHRSETREVQVMRQRIQQAVEDGDLSQGDTDWMLGGLDKGPSRMGRGFNPRHGPCNPGTAE